MFSFEEISNFLEEEEEEIQELWRDSLDNYFSDCLEKDNFVGSQCETILTQWKPELLNRTKEIAVKDDCKEDFEILVIFKRECSDAMKLLRQIQYSLSLYTDQFETYDGSGHIWLVKSHETGVPHTHWYTSITDIESSDLERYVAHYIEKPWLQNNLIDWAVINATLFNQTNKLCDGIQSGELVGKKNWSYLFTRSYAKRIVLFDAGLVFLRYFLLWVAPPIAVLGLIVIKNERAAIIAGGLWGGLILFKLVILIVNRSERRKYQQVHQKYEEKLDVLIDVWKFTNSEIINPTRLREKLVEVDKKEIGPSISAVIYSLVDRAINRDSAVFTR